MLSHYLPSHKSVCLLHSMQFQIILLVVATSCIDRNLIMCLNSLFVLQRYEINLIINFKIYFLFNSCIIRKLSKNLYIFQRMVVKNVDVTSSYSQWTFLMVTLLQHLILCKFPLELLRSKAIIDISFSRTFILKFREKFK